ncbi:MAG: hypothetical protein RSD23_08680 [Ruthenibacterium sp.]
MKQQLFLFCGGGAGYCLLEIAARGYTHWSMGVTGGVCVLALFYIATEYFYLPVPLKAGFGALIITGAEFIVGCAVNLLLGWQVWNYAAEAGNLWGQICPKYTLYWFLLCLVFFDADFCVQQFSIKKNPATASSAMAGRKILFCGIDKLAVIPDVLNAGNGRDSGNYPTQNDRDDTDNV